MATSSATIQMPPPATYGAPELKVIINKNTVRGFLITVGIILLLLIAWFAYAKISERKPITLLKAPISKITLDNVVQDDQQNQDEAAPPPVQQVENIATLARAGTPVPVPDADIKEDLKQFASMEEMNKSLSANEGKIVNFDQIPSNFDFDQNKNMNVQKEVIPPEDEFIPVEKDPQVDLNELQKRVKYPEMARRAGVEGKVIIRVFVDKDGKPKRTKVQSSDSPMLEQAAVDAIMKSVYTPAIQNGQPVGCWVSIPVTFTLK